MNINIRFANENDLFSIEKLNEKVSKKESGFSSNNFTKTLHSSDRFILVSDDGTKIISYLCFCILHSISSKSKIVIYDHCFIQNSESSVKSMFLLLSRIDEAAAKYDCEINLLKNKNENSFTNSIFLQNNFKKTDSYIK